MITTGAKFFFGLAALALFGAAIFAWGNHGGLTGVLTGGLYGGVGDHAGYIVFLGAAAAASFLGGLTIAFRDADSDAVESLMRSRQVARGQRAAAATASGRSSVPRQPRVASSASS